MDFALNSDQQALTDGVQTVLRNFAELSPNERLGFHSYSAPLRAALGDNGFLDVQAVGLSPLDAGLVLLEVAKLPAVTEVAATMLVWPLVSNGPPDGPVALISGDPAKAVRFLPMARHALVESEDIIVVVDLPPDAAEPVKSVLAYPFGTLRDPGAVKAGRPLDAATSAAVRRRWRTAIALEVAGAAQSAIAFTVDYVTQRHVFGRPIGSFQAVQHRLAQCHQIAQGVRYAALYAAWADIDETAAIAANLAQRSIGKLAFDLHQFNGGMGVTNEHLLHFWTHRLRALQSELGGATRSGLVGSPGTELEFAL